MFFISGVPCAIQCLNERVILTYHHYAQSIVLWPEV